MTRVRALPNCPYRFGRTDIVESEDGKKRTARFILCCGYREVEPEECIICTGFKEERAKLQLEVITFMKMTKDLRFKQRKNAKG